MAASLVERIRKSRQVTVNHGGRWSFTVMRPTDMDMLDIQTAGKLTQGELLRRFVIGWEGVTELDVVPGGMGTAVPFSAELFAEWIADRPQLWEPLTAAIIDSYKAHEAALEEAAKN